jgi:hypothetical protein
MNHTSPSHNNADLIGLLKSADNEHHIDSQRPDAGALIDAARQRRTRSRRTRIASAALGASLVLATGSLWGSRKLEPLANSNPSAIAAAADFRQTLADLDRQAQQRLEIVRAMRQADRLRSRQAELESLANAADNASAAEEAFRSAAISLWHAMLVEREAIDAAEARDEYERVVRRFQGTHWAETAAASLERLSTQRLHPSL